MKTRNAAERRKVVSAYRTSGMSALEFSRKQGIHFTTLYQWMRSMGKGKALGGFRRVKISESPQMGMGSTVVAEIGLTGGAQVRVMRGCSEEELSMILKGLIPCGS